MIQSNFKVGFFFYKNQVVMHGLEYFEGVRAQAAEEMGTYQVQKKNKVTALCEPTWRLLSINLDTAHDRWEVD